ncbi:hypothetical protein V6238_00195 [Marinomonas arenicola]|uniref:hypothetical protein n=1 Tax=Marinomonas arenicola TaxID=569601 RepID=UPI00311E4660
MAISKGYIQCPERHCSEVAEVMQAGGKRSTLYTKCPACGTNQGNGVARQTYLSENLKASRDEVINVPVDNLIDGYKTDTQEKAAIPNKNEASSVSDDTDKIPSEKPKDTVTAPPVLLGVGVLLATVITAIFATRKPTHKPKGQTA